MAIVKKLACTVLGVSPVRIGGMEVYARELSRQLGEWEWNSVLCYPAEPKPAVCDFLKIPNVRVETLAYGASQRWPSLGAFARFLWRNRPEVLLLGFVGYLEPYAWIARLCGVKRIFFLDQQSWSAASLARQGSLLRRLVYTVVSAPLSGVICVSDFNARSMLDRRMISRGRLSRIYNGVDVNRQHGSAAAFRRCYNIPEDRKIVLQVSWLIPEKGFEDLLEAAQIVIRRQPHTHFVMVGDGPYRDQLHAKTESLGLGGHVTWTGLLEDPFAAGVYAAADILCQPSRWEEAFGFTIAEAFAAGKPVIASDLGGIPEVVQDGVDGFLVPPRNPAALAEKILRLLEDPVLRCDMGNRARRSAVTRFDVRHRAAEFLTLYGLPTASVATATRTATVDL